MEAVVDRISFVDSNIPMYAAGDEHPYKRPCQDVLERIRWGQLLVVTSTEVHQEIFHRYMSLHQPAKAQGVSERFQMLIPNVLSVAIQDVARARQLLTKYQRLSSRDVVHLAVMLNNGIDTIITVDRDFDTASEVKRLDPAELA